MKLLFNAYALLCLIIICTSCSSKNDARSLSALDHSMKGDEFLRQEQIGKALQEYKDAVRLDPPAWRHHYRLAKAYEKENMLTDAIQEYRVVLALANHVVPPFHNQADYAFPHFWLGRALYKAGQNKEAKAQLRLAIKIGDSDQAHNKFLNDIVKQSKQFLKIMGP